MTLALVEPAPVPVGRPPSTRFTRAIATARQAPGQWLVVAVEHDRSCDAYQRLHATAWRLRNRRIEGGTLDSRVRTRDGVRCIDIRWTPLADVPTPAACRPRRNLHEIVRIDERTVGLRRRSHAPPAA